MRGFFRMDYPREGGAGGTAVFTDGTVAGWDTGGCFFRGEYSDMGLGVEGALALDFPNGGTSLTGDRVAKGEAPTRVSFRIPNAARADEMILATPSGDVAVKLTRVSAL
jgi:hypothetical protein